MASGAAPDGHAPSRHEGRDLRHRRGAARATSSPTRDLEQRLDTTDEWIVERTGIRERRLCGPRVAGRPRRATPAPPRSPTPGARAEEVDRVIVATHHARPAHAGPRTRGRARHRRRRAAAADVNAACAGFLYGARPRRRAGRDRARAVRARVRRRGALAIIDHEDRSTAVLFGDGAGRRRGRGRRARARAAAGFVLGCGRRSRPTCSTPSATSACCAWRAREVYRHAVRRMVEAGRAALERAGEPVGDIDLFVAHQANARIVEAAARRARRAARPRRPQRRPRGQHLVGLDPARAGPGRARRAASNPAPPSPWPPSAPASCGGRASISWKERVLSVLTHARKTAARVVTGGTRGIGAAIAERLRRRRLEGRAPRAHGGDVQADVGDADAGRGAPSTRSRSDFGPVLVLVNNAGVRHDGLAIRMARGQWEAVIDTNLTGAFHCTRARSERHAAARAGGASSTSPRSSPSAPTRGRRTTPPPRPGCSASRAPSRARWRARA